VGEPRAGAVFVHCFTCGKDSLAAARVSRALAARGIAVLRFDFTGLGGSGGDFASTGFSSNVEDVVRAAEHLSETVAPAALLVGHSLGGAAALAAAQSLPDVSGVVTIAAPSDPGHVVGLLGEAAEVAAREGVADVVLGGRKFTVSARFLTDVTLARSRAGAARLRRPLLVLHSPADEVVGIDNAREIFEAAHHPKSFVALDGADHMLTDRADAVYVADLVAAWAARYLPPTPVDAEPDPPEGVVVVTGSRDDGLRHVAAVGRHRVVLDEPDPIGDDTGPTPYDALLAGLGACTAMTVRMYAQRKDWPLEDVTVALRHDRVHARDCAECEANTGRIDRIRREITLEGPLDEEQRDRLMDIADRCPVHRTLHSEIINETRHA
jgi:putative redox protein